MSGSPRDTEGRTASETDRPPESALPDRCESCKTVAERPVHIDVPDFGLHESHTRNVDLDVILCRNCLAEAMKQLGVGPDVA